MKQTLAYLVLLALACSCLGFQAIVVKHKVASGNTFTIHAGNPGACVIDGSNGFCTANTGSNLEMLFNRFTTPNATGMSNLSWGAAINTYWSAVDNTKAEGVALYADASATGTVTTSGTTVTWSAGTKFDQTDWGNGSVIVICPSACTNYTISSVNGSSCGTACTGITTSSTVSPACSSACPYYVANPGAKIAGFYEALGPSSTGWEAFSVSGLGTPVANTSYWLGVITVSSTQAPANSNPNWCPDGNPAILALGQALGSFTSASSWPAHVAPGVYGDGCISSYIDLTYTTTDSYAFVTLTFNSCDTGTPASCSTIIPAIGSNQSLIVDNGIISPTSVVISSVTDTTSGSTTDTLTKRGTCPDITSGVSNPTQQCLYSIDRATAGVTGVTSTYSATPIKAGQLIAVIAGTQSSSFDQSCYDSVVHTSVPFTGCTTTIGQTELLIGAAINNSGQSCCSPYVGNWISPTGSWNTLMTGYTSGNSPGPMAMSWQVAAAGSPAITATHLGGAGSPADAGGMITLK